MPKLVHLSLSGRSGDYRWEGGHYIPEYALECRNLPKYNLVQRIIKPKFATIVSISVDQFFISSDQLVCLLKVPALRLTSLNLYQSNLVNDAVINAIVTHQTKIVHLFINTFYLYSLEPFNLLCRHLEKLETFHFKGSLSNSWGLESLLYFKELRTLKIKGYLDNYENRFPKPTILQRLLDKPRDILLTHLDIEFDLYGFSEPTINIVKMCVRFIASRFLKLTVLRLSSCPLDENLFREITTNLVNLVVLRVEDCNLSDNALTGLKHMETDASTPPLHHLKRLTDLDLSCNEVTDASLESAFTSCSLKKLSLRYCEITDCGLVNLAAQPESFKRSIEELDLSHCLKVTDLGLSKLLPELKRLRVLNLEGCREVTSKTLETVKTYCPKLRYLGVSFHI
ncbi:uncharacterized protein LOC136037905 [Artemia franciscana]|uniref:uncharacterized protein LOC136037905 n=1 Tax=Artemia franciscana TaxID=6661 RepID=UPI0032DB0A8C